MKLYEFNQIEFDRNEEWDEGTLWSGADWVSSMGSVHILAVGEASTLTADYSSWIISM